MFQFVVDGLRAINQRSIQVLQNLSFCSIFNVFSGLEKLCSSRILKWFFVLSENERNASRHLNECFKIEVMEIH